VIVDMYGHHQPMPIAPWSEMTERAIVLPAQEGRIKC
jgi:hypothetical protein